MLDKLTPTPVENLQAGDMVDLENDYYADPFGNREEERDPVDALSEGDHMVFETEYAVVQEIEQETPECIVVHFDLISVGFPRGYQLKKYEPE